MSKSWNAHNYKLSTKTCFEIKLYNPLECYKQIESVSGRASHIVPKHPQTKILRFLGQLLCSTNQMNRIAILRSTLASRLHIKISIKPTKQKNLDIELLVCKANYSACSCSLGWRDIGPILKPGFKINGCPVVPDNQNVCWGNQISPSGCPLGNLICQPNKLAWKTIWNWHSKITRPWKVKRPDYVGSPSFFSPPRIASSCGRWFPCTSRTLAHSIPEKNEGLLVVYTAILVSLHSRVKIKCMNGTKTNFDISVCAPPILGLWLPPHPPWNFQSLLSGGGGVMDIFWNWN